MKKNTKPLSFIDAANIYRPKKSLLSRVRDAVESYYRPALFLAGGLMIGVSISVIASVLVEVLK